VALGLEYKGIEKFFESQYQATLAYTSDVCDGISEMHQNAKSKIERQAYEKVLDLIRTCGQKHLNKFG